jgi:hypothetical protein
LAWAQFVLGGLIGLLSRGRILGETARFKAVSPDPPIVGQDGVSAADAGKAPCLLPLGVKNIEHFVPFTVPFTGLFSS